MRSSMVVGTRWKFRDLTTLNFPSIAHLVTQICEVIIHELLLHVLQVCKLRQP